MTGSSSRILANVLDADRTRKPEPNLLVGITVNVIQVPQAGRRPVSILEETLNVHMKGFPRNYSIIVVCNEVIFVQRQQCTAPGHFLIDLLPLPLVPGGFDY